MPKINETAEEQSQVPMVDALNRQLAAIAISHSFTPTFVCGVNRKINTGNFENIDVYAGITLPVDADPTDIEDIKAAVTEIAQLAFALTSEETGSRYALIKEAQKGGRPAK